MHETFKANLCIKVYSGIILLKSVYGNYTYQLKLKHFICLLCFKMNNENFHFS